LVPGQSQEAPLRIPSILRPTHPKSNPIPQGQANIPGIPNTLQHLSSNRDTYLNEAPLPNPFESPTNNQPALTRRNRDSSQSPPRGRPHPISHHNHSPQNEPPSLPPRNYAPSTQAQSQIQITPPRPSRESQENDRRSESPLRRPLSPRSQAKADEEYAHAIARTEGIDLTRLEQEEKDKELAKKVWEEQLREGGRIPGGWND